MLADRYGTGRSGRPRPAAVLALEGAISPATVALAVSDTPAVSREAGRGRGLRGNLFQVARELLAERGLSPCSLDAIAVGCGPGSYTGLRVALGTASGMAFGGASAPAVLTGDTALVLARAARLDGPFRAAIPWGRLRVLLVESDGTAASSRVVLREKLPAHLAGNDRPLVVVDSSSFRAETAGLRPIECVVSPAVALAELAMEGGLVASGEALPAPDYSLPPDAVLPPRSRSVNDRFAVVRLGHGDVDEVAATERGSFDRPWARESLAPELASGADRLALGIRDSEGTLKGYVLARAVAEELSVRRVAVDPAARRQGLGRMLMRAVIAEGRERGVARIDVDVGVENRSARSLYVSEGFVEVGRRSGYYADGEDALLMSLVLRRS